MENNKEQNNYELAIAKLESKIDNLGDTISLKLELVAKDIEGNLRNELDDRIKKVSRELTNELLDFERKTNDSINAIHSKINKTDKTLTDNIKANDKRIGIVFAVSSVIAFIVGIIIKFVK